MYAIGKDAAAMKAVVGEEALSAEEKVCSLTRRAPTDSKLTFSLHPFTARSLFPRPSELLQVFP